MDQYSHSEISDNDSISTTSTIQSEQQEVYPLDNVLSERTVNGQTQYLVKWEGYSIERCTWEARENFQNDATLPDWEKTKSRVEAGLETPFDVKAFEKLIEKLLVDTEQRKARREKKRRRLRILRETSKSVE